VESQISQWNLSHCPHVKESLTPVTLVFSNESSGMQTTNVSKPGSLNPGKGKGKSERVKATEPLLEASSFGPVSEIRLKH
jgi:hypothetical protein